MISNSAQGKFFCYSIYQEGFIQLLTGQVDIFFFINLNLQIQKFFTYFITFLYTFVYIAVSEIAFLQNKNLSKYTFSKITNSGKAKGTSMEKSSEKTRKRQKPSERQSKSNQKSDSGKKKRKQSQTNQETIVQKIGSKNILEPECFICAQPYNLNRRIPVIACPNDHTFCLNCISLSLKSHKQKCPMCRVQMTPKQINSTIYHEVLSAYKEKNKHLHRELIEKSLMKLGIKKFSKKNSNMDDFETVPRTGKVIKRQRNEPSLLVLEPQMAQKQIRSFKFVYYPTDKVQVSFGVCIYDKFTLEMIENCGFDTKIIYFFIKKKDSFIKVDPKKGMQVVVNVDLQKNEIHWFSERQNPKHKNEEEFYLISTQAVEVGKKVGDLAFYPYIVLYNVGDMIEMNK